MPTPKAHRKPARRRVRAAKMASAREAIGELKRGQDVFILTFGQFSLIDALVAILDQTGPADVSIATWTASADHLERLAIQLGAMVNAESFRLIVDRSLKERHPENYTRMIHMFGVDSVRTVYKTHAKFMLIRAPSYDIVVRTSMNLNHNARLETIEISEDREFAEFFQTLIDGVFREIEPGPHESVPRVIEAIQETCCSYAQVETGLAEAGDVLVTHNLIADGSAQEISE